MGEIDRVLEELREMRSENREMRDKVVEVATRMEDVPDLKNRVALLEKWKWGTVGALLASGSSVAVTLAKTIGG